MSNNDVHALLSYHAMTGPLDPNPVSELDRIVNDLRKKYRTYIIPCSGEHGAAVLPPMFGHDFGDQIGRYATLIDGNNNKFEVLVERNNTGIYLTRGWLALRDFYKISLGCWVSMFFVGESKFEITLEDRFRRRMANPRFTPSMKFEIDRDMLPFLMIDDVPRPYVHDPMNFQFSYDKKLTGNEIDSGWLILAAGGFCRLTLNKRSTSVKLVDDFGNVWFCTLVYGRRKYAHFKIGGSWRRMVKARGLQRGSHLILGALKLGSNDAVYFSLIC